MTAIEARRTLLEEIASIIEDESLTQKVINYVRKLRVKEEEQEYISKEEVLAGIDAGLKEMKEGKGIDFDVFIKELEHEVYS